VKRFSLVVLATLLVSILLVYSWAHRNDGETSTETEGPAQTSKLNSQPVQVVDSKVETNKATWKSILTGVLKRDHNLLDNASESQTICFFAVLILLSLVVLDWVRETLAVFLLGIAQIIHGPQKKK
jgi:hypothetical protein